MSFSSQFISMSCGLIKLGDLFELYRENRNLPQVKSFNEELNQFFYADIQEISCHKDPCKKINTSKDCIIVPVNSSLLAARGWKNAEKINQNDILVVDYGHNGVEWSVAECAATSCLPDKMTCFNLVLRRASNFVISSHYHGAGFIIKSS